MSIFTGTLIHAMQNILLIVAFRLSYGSLYGIWLLVGW